MKIDYIKERKQNMILQQQEHVSFVLSEKTFEKCLSSLLVGVSIFC